MADVPNPVTADGWFDGATQPRNPGPSGIGALLRLPTGDTHAVSRAIGHATNNEAEYRALIALLELAAEQGVTHLQVRGDSQLVIFQVLGEWEVNKPALRALRDRARHLIKHRLKRVDLHWIPREQNTEADALSVQCLPAQSPLVNKKSSKDWGTLTQIGKPLGLSAVAVGKRLDAAELRGDDKGPTEKALTEGLAHEWRDHFGTHVQWHVSRCVAALLPVNKPP